MKKAAFLQVQHVYMWHKELLLKKNKKKTKHNRALSVLFPPVTSWLHRVDWEFWSSSCRTIFHAVSRGTDAMSLFAYIHLHLIPSLSPLTSQPSAWARSCSGFLPVKSFFLSTVACLEVRLGAPVMCPETILIVTDAVVTAFYVVVFSSSNNSLMVYK